MSVTPLLESRLEAWTRRTGGQGPFAIGIGGGSASGKSTMARRLAEELAPLRVEVLGQDRFFKPAAELPPYPSPTRPEPWPDYNRPDSFRVDELLAACAQPRPVEVLIVEGILVLHYEELRRRLDLALYVEADADERIVRRIRRNLA
ncbi:MAG: AAA family ATPase, partial [Gemmatimonadota bacterium]